DWTLNALLPATGELTGCRIVGRYPTLQIENHRACRVGDFFSPVVRCVAERDTRTIKARDVDVLVSGTVADNDAATAEMLRRDPSDRHVPDHQGVQLLKRTGLDQTFLVRSQEDKLRVGERLLLDRVRWPHMVGNANLVGHAESGSAVGGRAGWHETVLA